MKSITTFRPNNSVDAATKNALRRRRCEFYSYRRENRLEELGILCRYNTVEGSLLSLNFDHYETSINPIVSAAIFFLDLDKRAQLHVVRALSLLCIFEDS